MGERKEKRARARERERVREREREFERERERASTRSATEPHSAKRRPYLFTTDEPGITARATFHSLKIFRK